MVVVRKKVAVALLVACICICVGVCCAIIFAEPAKNASIIDFTVVIDAGHGGVDGGVVARDGTTEAELNLQYAKELSFLLRNAGLATTLTRKDGGGLYGLPSKGFKLRDMKARKKIADDAGANMLVSIHMNKYRDQRRKGAQVFFQSGNEEGKRLAASIQKELNGMAGRQYEPIAGDYYICREVGCPAVIVECGFVSNEEELAALKTEEYRKKLCNKIFCGIMLYLYEE